MAENIIEASVFQNIFGLKEQDIKSYSPLALAYLGDAVYEMYIRWILVRRGNRSVNKMNEQARELVSAEAQSQLLEYILPHLTPEETEVFRRGRNTRSTTVPRHSTVGEYRRATGFEALLGYLFLTGKRDRIPELIRIALDGAFPRMLPRVREEK